MAATVHLMIDEQARRTKALLPLRGVARYQLLVNDHPVAAFGGEDLPMSAPLPPGSYRVRVSSRSGWAVSNVLQVHLGAGESAWFGLDVDERRRPPRCLVPSGVVEISLLTLTRVVAPAEVAHVPRGWTSAPLRRDRPQQQPSGVRD